MAVAILTEGQLDRETQGRQPYGPGGGGAVSTDSHLSAKDWDPRVLRTEMIIPLRHWKDKLPVHNLHTYPSGGWDSWPARG